MRLGFLCFAGTGHLYPLVALGRCLAARGHHVTVFHPPMGRAVVAAAGLQFGAFSEVSGQAASAPATWFAGLRTLRRIAPVFEMYERRAPSVLLHGRAAIAAAGVDALVVDQADLAGSTVAESLALPFVTIATSPKLWLEPGVPPTYFSWRHRTDVLGRWRNVAGNALVRAAYRPVLSLINEDRRRRGMAVLRDINDTLSPRAIISQLPHAFEFPGAAAPPHLFYTGPFTDEGARRPVTVPWDRFDGRPLVYASLGTVRNDLRWVFSTIAAACVGLGVQLVISLGGGALMPEDLGSLPGEPVVVHFAPQLDVLSRATLTITHAGTNTVLESLRAGVPLVAIPLADDQPGVASRLCRTGAGTVVGSRGVSVAAVRAAAERVLRRPAFRASAQRMKRAIDAGGGAARAATIIEETLRDCVHESGREPRARDQALDRATVGLGAPAN